MYYNLEKVVEELMEDMDTYSDTADPDESETEVLMKLTPHGSLRNLTRNMKNLLMMMIIQLKDSKSFFKNFAL